MVCLPYGGGYSLIFGFKGELVYQNTHAQTKDRWKIYGNAESSLVGARFTEMKDKYRVHYWVKYANTWEQAQSKAQRYVLFAW
jgi:hypothetical protein